MFMSKYFLVFSLCCNILWNLSVLAVPLKIKSLIDTFEHEDKLCSSGFEKSTFINDGFFENTTGVQLPLFGKTEKDRKLYTGFRFLRTYSLLLSSLEVKSGLKVVHCNYGKVSWELNQQIYGDINWQKPLCFYIPVEVKKKKITKWKSWFGKSNANPAISTKDLVRNNMDHFNCFKLARRKKYTFRKSSLFFPDSWVGGLFYCDITEENKKNVIETMDDNLTFSQEMWKDICNIENSVPLYPLQSEDYSKNWVDYNVPRGFFSELKTPSNFEITKIVPYLRTTHISPPFLNLRDWNLSTSKSPIISSTKSIREQFFDYFYDNKNAVNSNNEWYEEIEVEENYKMTPQDISKLNNLTEKTINMVSDFTTMSNDTFRDFFSVNKLVNNWRRVNIFGRRRLNGLLLKIDNSVWNHLTLKDKFYMVIGSSQDRLSALSSKWKNIVISHEKYSYAVPKIT